MRALRRGIGMMVLVQVGVIAVTTSATEPTLLTVAERSGYKATARSAEVVQFIDQVARRAAHVRRIDFGKTVEGRPMVAAVVAQPPVSSPSDLAHDNRLPVLLIGGIHPGECASKEALLILLRELGAQPNHQWLKKLVLIVAPNFNADGNDRVGRDNRPHQLGPVDGMGVRANAQQLDLNRDWIKLETPEDRAMVKLIDQWNPYLFIDNHTTNGSWHQYSLTYDVPHNPASPQSIRDLLRNELLPEVTRQLEAASIKTFYYGNFSADHSKWITYGDEPRYSTEYIGIRGRLALLAEAHAYVTYEQRIKATHEFVCACVDYVARKAAHVKQVVDAAQENVVHAGQRPAPGDDVSIQSTIAPFKDKVTIRGYTRETEQTTKQPHDYSVEFLGSSQPTLRVQRPFAYLIPFNLTRVVDHLRMHGIQIEQLTAATSLDVELYRITAVKRAAQTYQGHQAENVKTEIKTASRHVPEKTYVVRTGQPLGNLVIQMLEPQAADSLATWNFFDPDLDVGAEYPIWRIADPKELHTRRVDVIEPATRLTLEKIYGPRRAALARSAAMPRWLPDVDSYVQKSDGRSMRVDAETGAVHRMPQPDLKELTNALAKLPDISTAQATKIAQGRIQKSPDGKGVLATWSDDLFFWSPDEPQAVRLTNSKSPEQFVTFSPDGKRIAFIRDYNLYTVDIPARREIALSRNGSEDLLFGKLDWVYQEELYGRGHYKAFWWSPDSKWIALLRLDETPVPKYTVSDNIPYHQKLEQTRYPIAGDPLPKVTLGIVSAAGGDIRWIDHSNYKLDELLIGKVDWTPDSRSVVYQVQNREQTWLDLVAAMPSTGTTNRLLHETTKAWVSILGPPHWLPDGSMLWLSERTGNKHIYHVSPDGKSVEAVTSGSWDVDKILDVDKPRKWIYFSATKDNPTATRAYRVRWDGTDLTCLTPQAGSHSIRLSQSKQYFFDSSSDVKRPSRVQLCRADGTFVRAVDPNLDDQLKYYRLGQVEYVNVPTRDGVTLPGILIKPADFDPHRKYPVLCSVYAGPQMPTVRRRWGGSTYLWHQLLAQHGYAIWLCDNRSASTRGASQAWSCYRDLGKSELQDIEDGLRWLKSNAWVDANRIGIWGWSYGGFMTSYALTHSQSFRAGIAGAPVTDWHNYDAIYTERYMALPAQNPDGYRSSSVVAAAGDLYGRLLLIHGTIDDNVHIANSMQFVNGLQNAGKQFQLMVYPKNHHGVSRPAQSRHLRAMMTDFILQNL